MDFSIYDRVSYPCYYQGQWLDSLLELRFVLSIESTHAWQRDGLQIYYAINDIAEGMDGGLRTYSPDLLIRNYETRKATLIEIKPTPFKDKIQLMCREQIAEKFIQFFGYDWTFEIIFANQISLSENAQIKYEQLLRDFVRGKHAPTQLTTAQQETYREFVMKGAVLPPLH